MDLIEAGIVLDTQVATTIRDPESAARAKLATARFYAGHVLREAHRKPLVVA